MRKKKESVEMQTSNNSTIAMQNEEALAAPQKIYVLPSEYRLAADKRSMEMLTRLGALDPEKISNKASLVVGGRCEYAVWGLFSDGLRLLQNDTGGQEYTLECLYKNGASLQGALEIEQRSAVSPLLREGLRSGVSFAVMGRDFDSRRKILDAVVCVSSAANPQLKVNVPITLVHPLKLAVVSDDFVISDHGRSLVDKREAAASAARGAARGVDIEAVPSAYVLPAPGEALYLQPLVWCSDGLYRYLERREIELKFISSNEAILAESGLRLRSKNNKPGIVATEVRLAACPEIKTLLNVEVIVPEQMYAYRQTPGQRFEFDADENCIKGAVKNKREADSSGSVDNPLTVGVGEELRLALFARYSDGRVRSLNLESCSCRVESSDDGRSWQECDALRVIYRKILVSRHMETKYLRLAIVPNGCDDSENSALASVLYLKTLQPLDLYLAPSHYLHLWQRGNWESVDVKTRSLNRLLQERTVGVDGWCHLDFIARYPDGSVRFVDIESLEFSQPNSLDTSARRKSQRIEENGYIKFRRHRRLMVDGLKLTKQPVEYQARISGTNIVRAFKISVSKIKALHLVQSGLVRRVLFDDKGQPIDISGAKLASDDILDQQSIELLPGQAIGVMVLAEYEDGCWGYCHRQTYELRNTAGVEALDRGFILVTPKKQTPELARVKATSANDRRISAEFFVDVRMPDRLCVFLEEKAAGGDDSAAEYREVLPDDIINMRIGEVLPFSVMAVYGNQLVSLRPSDYTVSTLGAGVRVWSGRSYASNAERERLEAVFAEELELEDADNNYENSGDRVQSLNSGVRFEAVKRTRENKTVEVTVRLVLKPSIKGSINIVVSA
ncbi:MAG: hypothetical protein Q4F00_06270 [bacterium]|nr:hypothetical protein [bacterium]